MTRLSLAILAFFATACSSFGIADHYASSFDATNRRHPMNERTHVDVVPRADGRFFSLGVLGLPVVPVGIAVTSPDEIEIEVTVLLHEDVDFSLAWHPCLELEGEEALCAGSARVDWHADRAVTDAGGERYERIPATNSYMQWTRLFAPIADRELTARVTRDAIYERAGYRGEPPAAYQRIEAVYSFPCRETCPTSFALDASSLVEIAGAPLTAGRVEFRTERRYEYDPLFDLQ